MSSIRKNYRLPKQTSARIVWLSEFLHLDNETRVLERAVDDLFAASRKKLRAVLIPHDGDHYSFVVSGLTLMDIPKSSLSKLEGYLTELLSPEGASYKTFGVVLLAAAASGESLVVYDENLHKVFDPDLYDSEKG